MGQEQQISRESVELAMGEFRRLGRTEFPKKYGFGKAREYFIHVTASDEWFDSKAIAGAAYGFQFPDQACSSSLALWRSFRWSHPSTGYASRQPLNNGTLSPPRSKARGSTLRIFSRSTLHGRIRVGALQARKDGQLTFMEGRKIARYLDAVPVLGGSDFP
jgi:hypothetical protein